MAGLPGISLLSEVSSSSLTNIGFSVGLFFVMIYTRSELYVWVVFPDNLLKVEDKTTLLVGFSWLVIEGY